MRTTCRVRSRSTLAAGAVHVRVRAMARRSSADSGTPAAAALARQTADSAGDMRTATKTVAALTHWDASPREKRGPGPPAAKSA